MYVRTKSFEQVLELLPQYKKASAISSLAFCELTSGFAFVVDVRESTVDRWGPESIILIFPMTVM
jgi:hypothetical protein